METVEQEWNEYQKITSLFRNVEYCEICKEQIRSIKERAADLIGFPVRVVVGAKGLANGGVEIKLRSEDKSQTRIVAPDAAVETVY